jgi:hypothetical protein
MSRPNVRKKHPHEVPDVDDSAVGTASNKVCTLVSNLPQTLLAPLAS